MMQKVHPGPLMQFRAHAGAREYLPLSVRSVGRFRVNADWRESFAPRWFLELYWTVEGRGCFYEGRKKFETKPGELFVYPPGSAHRLEAVSRTWEYCWVTFDHADCTRWVRGFGLGNGRQSAGPCPVARFDAIGRALALGTLEGECEAAHHAHALLIEASRLNRPRGDTGIARAKALLDEGFGDPALSIEAVAAELGVHRTTLYRLFRAQYGLNPNHYLKNLRLHRALQLVQQGDLPIGEIARSSGFNDPNYLSRLIKQTVGHSARQLRAARQAL
jgi:AraC-like DNA-binding protein